MKSLTFPVLLLSYGVVFCDNSEKVEKPLNGNSSSRNLTNLARPKTELLNIETESKNELGETRRNEYGPILVRSLRGGDDNPWVRQLNTSSILIFESVDNFKATVGDIKWLSNKKFRYPHLVYIPGVTASDIIDLIKDGFAIDKVNFLMNVTNDSVELFASFMFTEQKCRDNQLVIISRFFGHKMKWNASTFYPEKYNNLHGCKLMCAGALAEVSDDNFVFVRKIQKSLNFTPKTLNVSTEKGIEETKKALEETLVDLIADFREVRDDKIYISGSVLATDTVRFIVPPGEPYSALEKMFIMFDAETWIAIAGTFTFFLVAIQVINLCSVTVQNFIYGRNIRTPTLNVFDIFLNGGQKKIPGTNLARFIMILFIVWSLIIRTCYQSKMFEYLQADMRKPGPSTLKDIGFVGDFSEKYFEINSTRNSSDNRYYYCDTSTDFEECHRSIVPEPDNKAYALSSDMFIRVIFIRYLRSGIPSFVVLEEKYRTKFYSVPFKPFSPFYETFDRMLQLLNENGIALRTVHMKDFNRSEKREREKLNWRFEDTGPMVLTLEHLKIGFMAWGIMLAISFLVFLIELSIRCGRKCRRLMIRFAIIKTFLEGWLHFW